MSDQRKQAAVLLFCGDLMMISSVGGAASSLGLSFRTVSDFSELVDVTNCLLILDLANPKLDLKSLQQVVASETLKSAVAYGPHVHKERLDAAIAAGIGLVVTSGHLCSRKNQIIDD